MKRAFTLVLGLVCLSAIALAQSADNSNQSSKANTTVQGTITRVDTVGKMLTVKDTSGNDTTVAWTDSTKISGGSLAEGATVLLTASNSNGSLTATNIQVKAAAKPY